jgi:hypothetical protein
MDSRMSRSVTTLQWHTYMEVTPYSFGGRGPRAGRTTAGTEMQVSLP